MNREEQKRQSKRKILEAALDEFGKNDFFSASTNTMCKNHGLSKGLIFHYYKNKDELFLACVRECFEDLAEWLLRGLSGLNGSLEETLQKYMHYRGEFFEKYPYYQRIFYTAVLNTPEHLKNEIEEIKQTLYKVNKAFLKQILQEDTVKPGVDYEEVIKVIIDFGNYLQMKYRATYILNSEEKHKSIQAHHKEFINMMKMLCYGVIKEEKREERSQ